MQVDEEMNPTYHLECMYFLTEQQIILKQEWTTDQRDLTTSCSRAKKKLEETLSHSTHAVSTSLLTHKKKSLVSDDDGKLNGMKIV